MRHILLSMVSALALCATGAAQAQPRTVPAPAPAPTAAPVAGPTTGAAAGPALGNNIAIRMAGSNTVGQTLAAELLKGWAKALELPAIRVEAGAKAEEYDIIAERAEGARRLRAQVRAHGTGTGTEPLLRGQVDLWMASRQARQSDLDGAGRKGVTDIPPVAQFHAPGNEHVIALDALAVITHPTNPIATLSVAQVRDVFLGKINKWSQLGGPDLPIATISRDTNSGTFDTFCTLVMGIGDTAKCAEAMKPANPRMFESSEDLSDTVAGNPTALGFVGAAYQRSAKPVPVALSCGLAVPAETFTIKADEYPLSRRLYLYTVPGRAPNPATAAFLAFAQTTAGQQSVTESGAIDLLAAPSDPAYAARRMNDARDARDGGRTRIRPTDVQALEDATRGATRLSLTFRFQPGSDGLDARAVADLTRLAESLRMPAMARAKVTLIGFSQAEGNYQDNRALSQDRAEAIRRRLAEQHGLTNLTAIGVGPAAPVMCNDNAASALSNQRVEVWVSRPMGS